MESSSLVPRLQQIRDRFAGQFALRFDDRSWTFADLHRQADALAVGLRNRGIGPGDRVAFLLPNGPELIFLNLACLHLGAVAVPLNVRLKGAELAYILGHCRARLCIVHAELYPSLAPVRSELGHVEAVFIVGADPPPDCEPFDRLAVGGAADTAPYPAAPDHVAAILYTSGTTARPKGVTHTHGSLTATVRNYIEAVRLGPNDVVFGMLSISHIFGYTLQLLAPLGAGATVVAAASFEAPRVLELIGRYRVTHLYGLPVMFDALTRQPVADPTTLTTLRYCLAGGDSVSVPLNLRVRKMLGVELHEGCGMTEVIPYALNRRGLENRVGSIGPPSVGMNLRFTDEQGNEVPQGDVGEIEVKSDGLFTGYWDDREATAQVIHDGWFHTGDLGRLDADGYCWFVGRKKEIIVRGGSNISPLEVEAILVAHPAVREAAVVGVPHPTLGETVAAFIVLKPGATATAEELRQFAGEVIASYKVPERFQFVKEFARGLTGKVHRKTLKDWAVQGRTA